MRARFDFNKIVYLILAIIPFVCLIFLVDRYKVDVPYQDDWELVPLLDNFYQGTLSLGDFLLQHAERRHFFPKIVMIILVHFSGWNISYMLAMNILTALGIFVTLIYQMKTTMRSIGNYKIDWAIPIISLIIFSLNQWESWSWGWMLQSFMNVFVVVNGIILLANPVFNRSRFLSAVLLGIIATYSSANGIIYWFIGLLILSFISFNNNGLKKSIIILWMLAGSITIWSYL